MPTISFDALQTVALSAVVLFLGYAVRKRVGVLDRFNIPAPVVGGFLFAAAALALRLGGIVSFDFNTAMQTPLMVMFFTSIGLGASLGLLRVGGPQVVSFWLLASALAVVQNAVGVGLAKLLGVNPLLGLITGSITMTGGHGTGAAFGKLLEEQYAFPGAVTLAVAAATFGLVFGGLIGGPVGTRLIGRNRLTSTAAGGNATGLEHASLDEEIDLARRYLAIEQIRYGTRLRLHWDIDERVGSARVPPLVLQPLVENAVRHGIEPAVQGGEIWVHAQAQVAIDAPV